MADPAEMERSNERILSEIGMSDPKISELKLINPRVAELKMAESGVSDPRTPETNDAQLSPSQPKTSDLKDSKVVSFADSGTKMMHLSDLQTCKGDPEACSHLLEDNTNAHPNIKPSNINIRPFGKNRRTRTKLRGVSSDKTTFPGRNSTKFRFFTEEHRKRDKYLLLAGVIIFILIITVIIVAVKLHLDNASKDQEEPEFVIAEAQCGLIQGKAEENGYAFRGIPYAASPTGLLRWKPSKTLIENGECWIGAYKAHSHKPVCYQESFGKTVVEMSEDCLYLDIYTPEVSFRDLMPVLVYFAGDSFIGYDDVSVRLRPSARVAVANNVVIVHVNYRVHVFGFLALNIFHEENRSDSGNYGLYDMLTALRWIQMNIDGFGGDSRRVTLLGHGSSATGIRALTSSPLSKNLFNNVWIIGGATEFVNKSLEEVEIENKVFLESTNCSSRSCLVYKLSKELVDAKPWVYKPSGGSENFRDLPIKGEKISAIPVVDGVLISNFSNEIETPGISMVIGASTHEELIKRFSEFWNVKRAFTNIRNHLSTFDPNLADKVLKHYSVGDVITYGQYQKMVSDVRIICPLQKMAFALRSSLDNVYSYVINYYPKEASALVAKYFDIIVFFDQMGEFIPSASFENQRFAKTIRDIFFMYVHDGWLQTSEINKSSVLDPVPSPPGYLEMTKGKIYTRSQSYTDCKLWTNADLGPNYGRRN